MGVGITEKESVDELCDILFNPENPDGLHLNIVRYNIGGSNKDTKPMRRGGNVPEYSSDWELDDKNQVYFLKKSFDCGARVFEAFANSPPMYMTKSGQTSGSNPWGSLKRFGNIGFSNNLQSNKIEEFTTYLVNITQFLMKKGIPFTSISPINEPSGPGWVNGNNQEGCFYDFLGIRRRVFSSLRKKLEGTGLEIAGFEENNMLQALIGMIINPFIKVDRYNVHRYTIGNALGFNTNGVEDSNIFRRIIRYLQGKTPIWMSEAGFGYGPGITNYKDIQNSINFAEKVIDDLNFLKPSAWIYWQVIEDLSNNGWGCMQVDFNNPKNRIYGSQFTAFQHFTHFIKPGWQLIDVKQPKNKKIKIVVAINPRTTIKSIVVVSSDTIDNEININATIFKRMESTGDKTSTKVIVENSSKDVESLKIKANSVTSVMFMN
jgi:O-glycosyl hydrolase